MSDIFSKVSVGKRDTASSLEMQRITKLPVVPTLSAEEIDAFCMEHVQANYYEAGFRLLHTQASAVLAYIMFGGVFGPIGVGWGKTLITLMIADLAPEMYNVERSMLFVPPQVYSQLTRTDIPWARKRVGLSVPFIYVGGRSLAERRSIASSKKRGCYVLPYSYLSTRDAEEMLNQIKPQLLILDEVHNVKNRKAARTKRLMQYMDANQPQLVGLSGTITSKSIKDYHHLIAHALGDWAPLPLSPSQAEQWAAVLDANADPNEAQTGDLTPLVNWARYRFPEESFPEGRPGYRRAYNLRLTSAPGVVATGDAEIGVSLTLVNEPVKDRQQVEGWEQCDRLIKDVIELWRAPNGDEIEYGFHQWRHLYELSSGFYYDLRWPDVEQIVERRKLSTDEAESYLEIAKEHHLARQQYHRDLRRFLEYGNHRRGMDTPLLVANDMALHGDINVWPEVYESWRAAKDLEFEGMPERYSIAVEVCPYKIDAAVRWAEHHKHGGLNWYHHDHVGRWTYRLMKEAGLDVMWCPAEGMRKGSNATILDPANKNKIVIASMGGHGTGKNLQHFQQQLFTQFPRQAPLAEQVLGRTHRTGQLADELIVNTLNTLPFDHQNMAACLNDALYQHQTVGARQKLIYASYDPVPEVFPPDFLRERGFIDMQHLDDDAKALMEEKFGKPRPFEGI